MLFSGWLGAGYGFTSPGLGSASTGVLFYGGLLSFLGGIVVLILSLKKD